MISNEIDERTKKSKKHAEEAKRNETKEITLWLEYWAFAYRHKRKWEWTVEHTLKCCGAHNFPFYFKCPRYGLRQPKCIAKTFRLRRWCVRASVRTNDRINIFVPVCYHYCCWCVYAVMVVILSVSHKHQHRQLAEVFVCAYRSVFCCCCRCHGLRDSKEKHKPKNNNESANEPMCMCVFGVCKKC